MAFIKIISTVVQRKIKLLVDDGVWSKSNEIVVSFAEKYFDRLTFGLKHTYAANSSTFELLALALN